MPAIKNLEDLNPMHMDVLKEIGNIGSGSAATALSGMLGESVDISVPDVKTLDFSDTINFMGGAEKIVTGLMLSFFGEISGLIMYVLQEDYIQKIVNTFYNKKLDSLLDMDEMDRSAICEIGNIMAGSYVNAISGLTGLTIDLSTPSICIDMAGAILSVPAIEYATLGDKVLFINDNFKIDDGTYKCNMILIPDMGSLGTLFGKLVIEI